VSGPDGAACRFSVHKRSCDLVRLAREQVDVARARSPRASVELEAPPHLTIKCDPERLMQVLANLLNNAVLYAPDGEIRVRLERVGTGVRVSVRDEGPGIPADALETIFEAGTRLHHKQNGQPATGAGLGLSITRDIVEAHGGSISVENNPDSGATFTILLPDCIERVKGRRRSTAA
jgi:two-component system OmpR family sensor kinase